MKNLHTNNLINNVHIPHLLEDAVLTKSDGEQVNNLIQFANNYKV